MKNLLTIAFFFCGVLSTRLFLKADNNYFYQFAPAVLFILVALFVALLSGITPRLGRMALFAFLSLVIYFLLYFVTVFTGEYALFVGLLTGALGAFAFLRLAGRLITPMAFVTPYVLVAGALPFFINDLFYITGLPHSFWPLFKVDPSSNYAVIFAPIFFLWQVIVGRLFIHGLYLDRK